MKMIFLKKHTRSVLIIVLNFFILIYLIELVFFLIPSSTYTSFQNKTNSFDTRVKLEVINDLRKKNSNVYPLYIPSYYLNSETENNLFPLSGVSNSINVVCNETGEWFVFNSDQFGFNNSNKNWKKKIDIAVLGGSFTLGECVNDNFLDLLKKTTKKNIINMGVSGSGPLIQLAIFREYVKIHRPKKIIIFFFYNDFYDFEDEIKNIVLKKYLENKNFSQKLIIKNKKLEKIKKKKLNSEEENYIEESISYSLLKFLKISKFRQLVNLTVDKNSKKRPNCSEFIFSDQYNKDILKVYDSIKKETNENGGELIIINLPSYFSLFCNDYYFEDMFKSLSDSLKEKNIKFIDMTNTLKDKKNILFAYPHFGSHYSKIGNKILFNKLLKEIKIE